MINIEKKIIVKTAKTEKKTELKIFDIHNPQDRAAMKGFLKRIYTLIAAWLSPYCLTWGNDIDSFPLSQRLKLSQ